MEINEDLVVKTFQEFLEHKSKNNYCGKQEGSYCSSCFADWYAFNPELSEELKDSVREMALFHEKMVIRR